MANIVAGPILTIHNSNGQFIVIAVKCECSLAEWPVTAH